MDQNNAPLERDIMQDRDGFRESQRYAEGLGGPEFTTLDVSDAVPVKEEPSEQEIRLMAVDVARNLPANDALDIVANASVVAEYLRTGALPPQGTPPEATSAPETASDPSSWRPEHHPV